MFPLVPYQCAVDSVDCGMQKRVDCKVWSVEYKVWSVKCKVWSVECGV